MKVIVSEKAGRPETMTLATSPMVVWFDRQTRIEIEEGDELYKVADAIENAWGLSYDEACGLAACWFAMGERQHYGRHDRTWTPEELKTTLKRRYLTDAKTRSSAPRRSPARSTGRSTRRTSAKQR